MPAPRPRRGGVPRLAARQPAAHDRAGRRRPRQLQLVHEVRQADAVQRPGRADDGRARTAPRRCVPRLQRHRNRALPPLDPAGSAEDYAQRIREADAHIREFIRANDILTIPDYIGELATNVPWMVRPGRAQLLGGDPVSGSAARSPPRGDPRPPLRCAGQPSRHPSHPWHVLRRRTVGGLGLLSRGDVPPGGVARRAAAHEGAVLHLPGQTRGAQPRGAEDAHQRVDRGRRGRSYMVEHTPFLDRSVARVDAEIYLRRPPGYGSATRWASSRWTSCSPTARGSSATGSCCARFTTSSWPRGRFPIALIRYEMTGLDDEVDDMFAPPPPPPAPLRTSTR
jgi:hypothetical protein